MNVLMNSPIRNFFKKTVLKKILLLKLCFHILQLHLVVFPETTYPGIPIISYQGVKVNLNKFYVRTNGAIRLVTSNYIKKLVQGIVPKVIFPDKVKTACVLPFGERSDCNYYVENKKT